MVGIIEYPNKLCETTIHVIGIAFLCELKSKELKFRGSFQGEEIEAFKTIPDNTVSAQKIFLDKLEMDR